MFIQNRWAGVAGAALCTVALAFGQEGEWANGQEAPKPKVAKPKVKPEVKVAAERELAARLAEAAELREKARAVTRKMGELALSGDLPADAQGVQSMEQFLAELKKITQRLDAIEGDVKTIQGWMEGEKKALPTLSQDVAKLKRHKVSNYVQFQYLNDNRPGNFDSFRMRRVRLGLTDTIDARTSMKLSFDLAATQFGTLNEPAESAAQLRDAFLTYEVTPGSTWARGGRQPIPLGYEIERSSSDREFPERTQYNQALFPGERSTGLLLTHSLGEGLQVQAGAYNALTFNDPQQRASGASRGNRLAGFLGFRHTRDKLSVGVSGYKGKRETLVSGDAMTVNPAFDREFLYLDATYSGLFDPKLFMRVEAMQGTERLTSSGGLSGSATADNVKRDVTGHQIHLGYNINPRNQLNVRYEQFDRDVDVDGDALTGWGLAYIYHLNPAARLTAAFEEFEDPLRAAKQKYQVTTFRVQFKF